jgi:two-component sensor histidine kinase
VLSRLGAELPDGAFRIPSLADAQPEIRVMTSTDSLDFDLARRLNSGLKRIASAHGIDSVLRATAAAARELANAAGLCAVPADQARCVISTPELGTVIGPDSDSSLQRLIATAIAGGEAIVQHHPFTEMELPSGRRLLAETLLTVPLGVDSGYVGLAFFWQDGVTPTNAQLSLLPGLAWTSCLALRAQQDEAHLREHRVEQQTQIAESQQRARNVFATVRSIIQHSAQSAESSEEFASHLQARINALARIQGALTLDQHSGPEFEDLFRAELAANAVRDSQFVIAGPSWRLPARAAETIALALHELTMNAVKFGAFSVPDGRLTVNWSIDTTSPRTLRWRWIESNVHIAPTGSRRRGFGRELIERLLPQQLGATTRYTIVGDGARCEINLPVNERTAIHGCAQES